MTRRRTAGATVDADGSLSAKLYGAERGRPDDRSRTAVRRGVRLALVPGAGHAPASALLHNMRELVRDEP